MTVDPCSEPNRGERFRDLLRQVSEGQTEASETIVREYGSHILRAVRRRMNRSIRDRFDSEDFAQAVWASFFGHLSIVQRIETEGELAGFLGRMASNKVIDAGRRTRVRQAKNSSHDELPAVVSDKRRGVSQPTPSQFAVANEKWDRLNESGEERERQLLNLLRNGASRTEIAEAMGFSERHLRRILGRISRKHGLEISSD